MTSAAGAVAEMASEVEAFQQAVLPTFKVPPEALGGREEKAPLAGDQHGLGKQVSQAGANPDVEQRCRLLDVILLGEEV